MNRAIAKQLPEEINPCLKVPVHPGSNSMSGSQMMTTSSCDLSSHQIFKCAAKSCHLSFGNQGQGVPTMFPRDKEIRNSTRIP